MTQWSSSGGSKAQTGTLTWNANGTLQKLQMSDTFNTADNGMTCTHSYDDLARLVSANCGNSIWVQNFSYDPYGNITKTVPTGATGLSFTNGYGSGNHVSGYTYDAMGNVTNDGSHPFAYDAEGRPTTAGSKTILYDAFNRAVSVAGSSTTEILYDAQGRKFGFMNGQAVTSYIVPLVGGVQAVFTSAGLKYYRHADWLGTSRLALNTNGVLYGARAFAPFGEAFAETGTTDRVFTGQTQDSIPGQNGYFDFLFRQQSAAQGRWMVPDPAGTAAVDPSNPQTWNRYAYVGNNPLNSIDPLGLCGSGQPGDPPCQAPPQSVDVTADAPSWFWLAFEGWPGTGSSQSLFCMMFGGCGGNSGSSSGGSGGGGDTLPPAPKPPKAPPVTFTCQGTATYTGVGGNQATGQGALFSANGGPSVPGGTNGTVAVSRADNNTFNLSKAQLRVFGPYIEVSPQGLTSLLTKTGGPQPPYTVSDIGDIHVQSGQFDIYRFPTNADALNFGRRTAPTTIVVPAVTGAQCPAGFTRVP